MDGIPVGEMVPERGKQAQRKTVKISTIPGAMSLIHTLRGIPFVWEVCRGKSIAGAFGGITQILHIGGWKAGPATCYLVATTISS